MDRLIDALICVLHWIDRRPTGTGGVGSISTTSTGVAPVPATPPQSDGGGGASGGGSGSGGSGSANASPEAVVPTKGIFGMLGIQAVPQNARASVVKRAQAHALEKV